MSGRRPLAEHAPLPHAGGINVVGIPSEVRIPPGVVYPIEWVRAHLTGAR